jgi:hypothetical protein
MSSEGACEGRGGKEKDEKRKRILLEQHELLEALHLMQKVASCLGAHTLSSLL